MRCFVGFSYIHSNIASTINTSFLNETIQSTVQKALPYFLLSALSSASLIPSLLQKHFLIQGLTREGSKVVKKLFHALIGNKPLLIVPVETVWLICSIVTLSLYK